MGLQWAPAAVGFSRCGTICNQQAKRWPGENQLRPGRKLARNNSTTAVGLIVLATLSLLVSGCDTERRTLTFATGNPSGIYYPFGGGLASIWSRTLDGVNMKAEVTGASMINVIQVARGESEVGIAMGDVVASAYLGENRFPEPLPVRTLFAAYPNVVHLVARADAGINQVADLRGKRVSMGAPGSGTSVAAENILTGLDIPFADVQIQYLNFSGTADGIKDGVLDAAFIVGGLGIGVVKELALTRDVVLVGLTPEDTAKLNSRFPAYLPELIPQATYRGVVADVPTLGTWNLVVVNENMEEALAYRLLCSLYKNQPQLESIVAAARFTTPANADRMAAVPLHPGAARYLKELANLPGEPVANAAAMDCRG